MDSPFTSSSSPYQAAYQPSRSQSTKPSRTAPLPAPTMPPPAVPQSTSSSSHQHQHRDVYSHPAARSYLDAHPKRTIPKFGPYLLLQTLGEGEFGKVKLGLHSTWGEEVAVKLIRRAGVDGTVRMSKVEREIEVLRTLRHPNIVHLYDVIETDKYIGIIIEYASGGELFDHILAHRYLKEKDACKLFAQLISGVWYIHQKKIVHRDLKLENLLLDRNRNVIITDFGFANRFEHQQSDLMQTSCGSPCYAAPELVISEGLYVGSAVDIWSCGVILYAMLAGYLPFDDDPDNPDGDNINLLYKYIINTELTFPDYVSAEARDLLGRMLVPDPSKRAQLPEVMRHRWLEGYRYLFERNVKDLEAMAAEGQRIKRLAYQKQMLKNKENLGSSGGSGASPGLTRSQSTAVSSSHPRERVVQSMIPVTLNTSAGPTAEDTMDVDNTTDVFGAVGSSHMANDTNQHVTTRRKEKERDRDPQTPSQTRKASKESTSNRKHRSPSSASKPSPSTLLPPSDSSALPLPVPTPSAGKEKKKDRSMRHTIQVEYEDFQPPPSATEPFPVGGEDPFYSIAVGLGVNTKDSDTGGLGGGGIEISESMPATPTYPVGPPQPMPPLPLVLPVQQHSSPKDDAQATVRQASSPITVSPQQKTVSPSRSGGVGSPGTRKRVNGGSPVPTSPISLMGEKDRDKATPPSSWSKGKSAGQQRPPSPPMVTTPPPPAVPEKEARAKNEEPPPKEVPDSVMSKRRMKGLSFDKIGIQFGKTKEKKEKDHIMVNGHETRSVSEHMPVPHTPMSPSSRSASDSLMMPPPPPPAITNVGRKSPSEATTSTSEAQGVVGVGGEETVKEAKTRRRKTITSLMMDPIIRSRSRQGKGRSVTVESNTKKDDGSLLSPTPAGSIRSTMTKMSSSATPPSSFAPPSTQGGASARTPAKVPLSASTSKAQKVMQWFRGGKHRQPTESGTIDEAPLPVSDVETGYYATDASSFQNSGAMESSSTINRSDATVPVIVTPATPGKPSRYVNPPSSWLSNRSVSHGLPIPSPTNIARGAIHAVMPKPQTYNRDAIRIHHGAVDQGTVTSGAPPEVFAHVTQVLINMGVEVQKEAEYKYRCIRARRKKETLNGVGLGIRDGGAGSSTSPTAAASGGLAAVSVSGSATLNGVDQRGLPTNSSVASNGVGMFKNMILRRHSSRQSTHGAHSDSESSPAAKSQSLSPEFATEPSSPVVTMSGLIEPLYGEKAVDQWDEVRFSVELTRIDRLDDTFSLDIRRLKGNLRSYKFLYDTLRERCNFSA